jgi:hypothetical protein
VASSVLRISVSFSSVFISTLAQVASIALCISVSTFFSSVFISTVAQVASSVVCNLFSTLFSSVFISTLYWSVTPNRWQRRIV